MHPLGKVPAMPSRRGWAVALPGGSRREPLPKYSGSPVIRVRADLGGALILARL